ncbi:hypothetical protein ZIOFF_031428 [Zingiber officinale]|uniref:P-type ATPase C-terminal domain-containing protein n=1 Tax=Zingiber officinale TaxID=94328 RepID=A0A8J5GTV2_ZINOF|nr:hypothetical protein ZIOFF_031428 [Zingiber officinale]
MVILSFPHFCNETKLGMSRGVPEPKLTAVDAMIDKLTGAIFLFQIVVVIVLGFAGNIWKDTEARKQWYAQYPEDGPWYELLVIPLRFELLCSIMIPISLKVSLDLVKSIYAKFIDWDEEMYDHETMTAPHAANTAISEDLGQVEYILTDKTGTLTENKMSFRRCCINGTFYGNESGDALKDVELLNAVINNVPDVIRFLTIMTICNTVVPVRSMSGNILYKAQSQDEDALVNAAARLHMVLISKNGNSLEINFNGKLIHYEILDTLEFTSDRKRMSVVVKDSEDGKILLLSKGADEAILPLSYAGQQIRPFVDAVDQYAQLGLRTLCLGWRELKDDEYKDWSQAFKEARSTLVNREWKLDEVCQRLEHDLEVIGVTAVEDQLQDGVPETIETLRKAGINFWMLTGDKQKTAIQIALLCNFISSGMQYLHQPNVGVWYLSLRTFIVVGAEGTSCTYANIFPLEFCQIIGQMVKMHSKLRTDPNKLTEPRGQLLFINGKTEDEVLRSLERVLLTMKITSSEPKDLAFVVDGWALEIILKQYRSVFTELAILSRTAICCRVTPSQKAQLVELLKSCDYRTLAIGDGGNDVRMIQNADIGVGISGREGLQAARAADYSIGIVLRNHRLTASPAVAAPKKLPIVAAMFSQLSTAPSFAVRPFLSLDPRFARRHYTLETVKRHNLVAYRKPIAALRKLDRGSSAHLTSLGWRRQSDLEDDAAGIDELLEEERRFEHEQVTLFINKGLGAVVGDQGLGGKIHKLGLPFDVVELVDHTVEGALLGELLQGVDGDEIEVLPAFALLLLPWNCYVMLTMQLWYGLSEFRFLKRLILVHGRYSYNRTAFLSQYSFYKSLLICFIQILYVLVPFPIGFCVSGTSLFNSISLMAYNVFYTSVPVLTVVLDKDLTEKTALVVFLITVHAYADEKSEMEQLSMVALSGCIWLQAFVVTIEMNSFTIFHHLAIWGNLLCFYGLNLMISAIPSAGLYTIMFRLCRQPSYWITLFLITVVGMGPVLALKYFRYTYRSSAINILQQAERSRVATFSIRDLDSQLKSIEKDVGSLASRNKFKSSVYEPLITDSPTATRRAVGPSAFDFLQPAQSRLSTSYSRNCKDN